MALACATAIGHATVAATNNPTAIPSPANGFLMTIAVTQQRMRHDPRMVRDLHSRGVPHLPVRVRDGTGLVGPLVIPGVTSCLGNYQ
jgi:hypothetical protein